MTTKDKQTRALRFVAETAVREFEAKYPTKTIGNHHYIRSRNLEQFLYDFAHRLVKDCEAPVLFQDECFKPVANKVL